MEFFWLRLCQPLEKKKGRAFRFLWPLKPEAFPSDQGQRADRGQSHQTGAWAAAENIAIDPDSDFYWKQGQARFRGLLVWNAFGSLYYWAHKNKMDWGKAEVLDNLSFAPQIHLCSKTRADPIRFLCACERRPLLRSHPNLAQLRRSWALQKHTRSTL